ncbi:MAG TPA: hypothetical protein PKE69_18760 [Pyrinomonadaceae bacterium]|nr:hypothetical protein [Pyrinomonadaceae bacterium]
MSKNLISFLLLIITVPIFAFGQTAKVEVVSILDRQVNQSELDDEEIIPALMKSFYSTKVPAGVSGVFRDYTKDEFEPKLNLSSKKLSLRDVLKEVTTLETRYQWKEENGVINVYPINDYPILDTVIAEFYLENKTKENLLSELLNTKEFQEYLKKNQLSVFPFQIISGLLGKQVKTRRFTINLKNVTVREILNEIVRQNGKSTWIYKEYESNFLDKENTKRYYRLDFLVDTP